MKTFEIQLAVTPRLARWLLTGGFLALAAVAANPESVTLNTYYPAPSGIYVKMVTTSDTTLARDGGTLTLGSSSTPASLTAHVAVNPNPPENGTLKSGMCLGANGTTGTTQWQWARFGP